MRKFKKCLTLLLVLSMIVTTVPLDVFANETQGVQNVENKEGEYENEDEKLDNEEVNSNEKEDEVSEKEKIDEKDDKLSEEEKSDEKEDEASGKEKLDEKEDETSENEKSEDKQENTIKQTKIKSSKIASRTLTTADSGIMTALEDVELTAEQGVEYRILHLDCGRKYFTKDWIIALINEMSYAGFNQLQLAFGNDGMRLLLDDMEVSAGTTTYSSEQVKAGIKVGNKAYYDAGDKNELTQSEMTEIVNHAKSKGIEIVPHMNMPGHMDAILDAIEYVGISDAHFNGWETSKTSLNLNNSTAVTFTQELLKKYVNYFDGLGCKYFHIGADEFANDAYSGNMGFPYIGDALYTKFAKFVDDAAKIVKSAEMTPRAWNDGISYTKYSDEFDTDIQVTYWSPGWWGYDVASAGTLAGNGHPMINTHGNYYYILGKDDFLTPGDNTTHDPALYTAAADFDNTKFAGDTIVSNSAGSMFCIWADYPGAETETQIAANTRLAIRAMGLRMQGESIENMDTETVVEGGFAADGTISKEGVSINTVTDVDKATDVYVTGPHLTHLTATIQDGITAEEIGVDNATNIKAWDITPYVDTAPYAGKGTVSLPVPENWNSNMLTGFYVENGKAVLKNGEYADGNYTFDMPHFSVAGIAEIGEDDNGNVGDSDITENRTINLILGETATDKIEGGNYKGTYTTNPEGIATVTAEYEQGEGGMSPTPVTSVSAGSSYYMSDGSGKYLTANATWTSDVKEAVQWTLIQSSTGPGYYMISNNNNKYLFYNDGWVLFDNWGDDFKFINNKLVNYYYPSQTLTPVIMEGTTSIDQTKVIFRGTAVGSASVEVGPVHYDVNVNYVEKTIDVPVKSSRNDEQSVTVADFMDDTSMSNEYVTANWSGNTVTFTANEKTGTVEMIIGNTKYTVNVIEENLAEVEPLNIEYWITNARISDEAGNNSLMIKATDVGINTAAGVEVKNIVANNTYSQDRPLDYWKTLILDIEYKNTSASGTALQVQLSGDDETRSGSEFTKVRYWQGNWQVYTDKWIPVDRTEKTVTYTNGDGDDVVYTGEKNQLIAYYMENLEITDNEGEAEIRVNSADWGTKGDGKHAWSERFSEDYKAVGLAIQLVYEDGSVNPSSTDENVSDTSAEVLKSKTFLYHDWNLRGVGTLLFTGNGDHLIYKITAETGNMEYTTSSDRMYTTVNKFEWHNDAETVWEKEDPVESASVYNAAIPEYTSVEPPLDNLAWQTNSGNYNNAILIRVYVKAIGNKDSLVVHYVDDTFDNEFYTYSIPVKENTTFDSGFALVEGEENTLVNNSVKQFNNQTRTVTAELSEMSEIGAQYRYSNYKCVSVNFAENVDENVDGSLNYKEVYLHYTFSPVRSFVADFGLPLEFDVKNLDTNLNGTNVSEIELSSDKTRYGTVEASGTTITYTPTKVLTSVDAFTVLVHTTNAEAIEGGGDGQVAFRVYIVPATTVFYEEGFIETWTGSWSNKGSKGSGTQELQVTGVESASNYGYTTAYETNTGASSGTEAISTIGGEKAEFTFTGNGVDIYANCATNTSTLAVLIYNADTNALEKFYQVATKTKNGTSLSTDGQEIASYNLPVVSAMDLSYGNHKVLIQHTKSVNDTTRPIKLDGFRVYNTLTAEQQYIVNGDTTTDLYAADEQMPMFVELRDEVLAAMNVNIADSIYTTAGEIINQVYNESETLGQTSGNVLVLSGNTAVDAKDLLDNGPKNELFLQTGDVVTFNLGSYNAQIGMKAINGATKYEISFDEYDITGNATGKKITKTSEVGSSIDMFYQEGVTGEVTLKNTGNNILSITKLKVFGGIAPYGSFAFEPISEEQVTFALRRMVAVEESVEPELPEVPEGGEVAKVPESSGKPESNSKPATSTAPEDSKDSEPSTEVEDSKVENVTDTSGTTESTDSTKKEDTSKPTTGNETSDAKEETEDTKEETLIKNEESDESVEETVDTESDESIEETEDEDAGTESTGFFGWIVGIFNAIVDFFKNLFA